MYQRILVATDGSKLSQKAVQHGLDLADITGADVIALKVAPRYPQSYFEGGVALAATEVARIEKQWQAQALEAVNAVRSAGQLRGIKVKPVVARSDVVSDAIIATARRQKCDLIVMASHGRRGIKRLLLGSETQQVLTHANIPVLVLR